MGQERPLGLSLLLRQKWNASADTTLERLGPLAIRASRQFTSELEAGDLITVDEDRQRARLLRLGMGTSPGVSQPVRR